MTSLAAHGERTAADRVKNQPPVPQRNGDWTVMGEMPGRKTSDATPLGKTIRFVTEEGMPKEGYKLSIAPNEITLSASHPNGFFYGVQTMYQLLPPAIYGKATMKRANWSLPAVEVEDAPRFPYRGLMLDVCRHFSTTDYIYKFIDMLAMHKMNTFHFHLTDDQGWRIEIKKYPKLQEVGSKRKETLIDYYFVNWPQIFDGQLTK